MNKPPYKPPNIITGINKAGRASLKHLQTSHKSNFPRGNLIKSDTLTIITASLIANINPGIIPAKNKSTIDISVMTPNRIKVILGGIRSAIPPAEAITPAAIHFG